MYRNDHTANDAIKIKLHANTFRLQTWNSFSSLQIKSLKTYNYKDAKLCLL